MTSSVSQAPPEDLPQTKRKNMKNSAVVVDLSLMPKENKTIEQYLKDADYDFVTGGADYLTRAQKRYQNILTMFPGNEKEKYIHDQIKRIQQQLDDDVAFLERSKKKKASSDASPKKNSLQGKIDPKT